ncbi:MAG: hypothetical protein Q9190_007476 [Brigantiaea leucoxantha]
MADKRVAQIAGHLYPKGMLDSQTAIITGSGQGIGFETAKLFAQEGAKVVVQDIDAGKAQAVAKSINEAGGEALAVAGDMLDGNHIDELVRRAAEFGGGKIHIIVNNAGFTWDAVIHKLIYLPHARTQMTDKQWETIVALHNTAPFKLIRAAAPFFRVKDGEPRNIINISSTSGVNGKAYVHLFSSFIYYSHQIFLNKQPTHIKREREITKYRGQANYALAKAGVTGLTKAIAKEWGPAFGVRANTVGFGHILTRLTAAREDGAFITTSKGERVALGIPRAAQQQGVKGGSDDAYPDIPLRRPGTATEAAKVILAVAGPLCSYVTGQTVMVGFFVSLFSSSFLPLGKVFRPFFCFWSEREERQG